jgi:hypothetical protein
MVLAMSLYRGCSIEVAGCVVVGKRKWWQSNFGGNTRSFTSSHDFADFIINQYSNKKILRLSALMLGIA